VGEGLYYNVEVVVFFDVVHSHEAWRVFLPKQCPCCLRFVVEGHDLLLCVSGV